MAHGEDARGCAPTFTHNNRVRVLQSVRDGQSLVSGVFLQLRFLVFPSSLD